MIDREELIKIGFFNKPHGIHGELSFTFTDDIFDREDCPYIVCEIEGIFVPFFIEEYRFKSDTTVLMKLEDIEATGNFLLDTMPIMFIPASVGLIDSYDAMKAILIPLIVTCLVSTVVVMGVTGKVTEFMVKLLKKNKTNAGEETKA